MKATCIAKKQQKDLPRHKSYDLVGCNKKKLVRNGFLRIFGTVKYFQYFLEGRKTSSDKVTPESNTAAFTDIFRFELFC